MNHNALTLFPDFLYLSIWVIILANDFSIRFPLLYIIDSAFREKRLVNDQTNKINGVAPQLQFLPYTDFY